MASWDISRERKVWWAAIALLTIAIGWLQVVNLVLLWNLIADRAPEVVTVVRAVARVMMVVVRSSLPALVVGLAIVVTMTAVLAGNMRSEREEVQHG